MYGGFFFLVHYVLQQKDKHHAAHLYMYGGTTGHIGLVLRLNMKWGGVSVIHMMRVESIWLMHMSGVAFPWQLSSDMFVYKNRCLFDAVKPTRKSLDYL